MTVGSWPGSQVRIGRSVRLRPAPRFERRTFVRTYSAHNADRPRLARFHFGSTGRRSYRAADHFIMEVDDRARTQPVTVVDDHGVHPRLGDDDGFLTPRAGDRAVLEGLATKI